jgi:hypothetical protein
MRFLRAQAFLATALVTLGLHGCDDPVQRTDLRPAGPPDLLTVLVMNDADFLLYERATYCKANDDKAPTLVAASDFSTLTICPEEGPIMDAVPEIWYLRLMFDELLDPAVEELLPVDPMDPDTTYYGSLARTQPVILRCGTTTVPYDGWYAPNGNNVTWPLGPSLVIMPDHSMIATGDTCSVEVKDTVVDKEGNQVPMDQRGPHDFGVAALRIVASDPPEATPPDPAPEVSPDTVVVIDFNASLDPSVDDTQDVVTEEGGAPLAGEVVSVSGASILVEGPVVDDAGTPGDPSDDFRTWPAGDYTVTIPVAATITDIRGGGLVLAAPYVIAFTVL